MKILQVHNYYQHAGGEDTVVRAERELLEAHNHEVIRYERNNAEIHEYSAVKKARLLWQTTWSDQSFKEITAIIKASSPDICHVHNFFPLITPSIYYACAKENIPVVQTLHNYRLICANGLFFRDGKICEKCLHGSSVNGIIHACYRDSRVQSATVVSMNEVHRTLHTWEEKVDTFVCLTQFARGKFLKAGFPKDKLVVKQNFLQNDPGFSGEDQKFFLFVGRLDAYKGIHMLLEIAPEIARYGYRIVVVGDGPEKVLLENSSTVEYAGKKSPADVALMMKKCTALIFPSLLYEGMPMTIIEAFACGKPVIASRLGGPAEMIDDGVTGWLFDPGDKADLLQKLLKAITCPEEIAEMALNARRDFEEKYTSEKNHALLLNIYHTAIDKKAQRRN